MSQCSYLSFLSEKGEVFEATVRIGRIYQYKTRNCKLVYAYHMQYKNEDRWMDCVYNSYGREMIIYDIDKKENRAASEGDFIDVIGNKIGVFGGVLNVSRLKDKSLM